MKFQADVIFLGTTIRSNNKTGRTYRLVKLLDLENNDTFTCVADDIDMDFSDLEKLDIITGEFNVYLSNNNNIRLLGYVANAY